MAIEATKKVAVNEKQLTTFYGKLQEFQTKLSANEKALFVAMLEGGLKPHPADTTATFLPLSAASLAALRGLLDGKVATRPAFAPQDGDGFWAQWAERKS